MLEIKIRKAVVYATTGVFFLVAALAQLQGDLMGDTALKAGLACAVMYAAGKTLIRIVTAAIQQPAPAAAPAPTSGQPVAATAPTQIAAVAPAGEAAQ